jgi:hypothetical protein
MALVDNDSTGKLRIRIVERNVKEGWPELRVGVFRLAGIVGLQAFSRVSVRRARRTRVRLRMSSFLKKREVPIMKVTKVTKVFRQET